MGDRNGDKDKGESPSRKITDFFWHRIDSLFIRNKLATIYTIAFVALSLVLFPPSQRVKEIKYKEGEIADSDIIAPFSFLVPLSEQEIEINKAKAAINVPPVYRSSPDVKRRLSEDLKLFFGKVDSVAAIDTLSTEEKVSIVLDIAPGLKDDAIEMLLSSRTRKKLLREGTKLIRILLDRGIVNDASPMRRREYPTILVIEGDKEKVQPTTNILDQDQLEGIIIGRAKKIFGRDKDLIRLFFDIVRSHIVPNLIYDPDETAKRREEAVKNVQTAFKISKNQRIVAKHDKVSKRQVDILKALEKKRSELELATSKGKKFELFFGKGLRVLLLVILLGLAVFRFDPDIMRDSSKLTLLFIVIAFFLFMSAIVVNITKLDPHLIPVAFVSLIAAAFFDVQMAVVMTIFSSLMIVTHTKLPPDIAFISVLAGALAIVGIKQLRERKNFYKIFLYVSSAYIVGILGFGLDKGMTLGSFLTDSLWGIINSFFCSIIVMFILPIFESLFDLTTDFTLMELSDLNRPLLKRLLIEAPGTYHHSIMVGNMVEAVAEDIGANSLLARVGAYYHDIGKLAKPEYFFENKGESLNKHEKLTPTMSALILASHVKEGVEMAKKEKLPKVVIDAIREHHGTTVMAYFYQKALEYDSHDSVNIDDFRYPGPRPRSKETALIMLADSAEAAVRSLKEPTAPRIRGIVEKIIESRMNDGELDESGLTLNDIAVIRERFIQILTGIFHPRISYPAQEEGEQISSKGKNRNGGHQLENGRRS